MDILELLKKYGLEISEEEKNGFNTEFRKAFKSAAELKKVKDERDALQLDLDKANETIENSKTTQTQTDENEKKYKDEIEGYKAQLAEIKFTQLLDAELKGIEFSSDRVKSSVVADIRAKGFEEKDGKLAGLSDYLKDLYTSEPDSFKAVDNQIHTWGSSSVKKEEKEKPNYFGMIL